VDGAPVAQLIVGGRGLFARVDVDLKSAGTLDDDEPGGDLDGDGIPNYLDNCAVANASQADANGDGIGDACEGLTNAPPVYLDVDVAAGVNPADPTTGLGAVDYEYRVADTEVTNAQYAAMLSAVAAVGDPLGLYNPQMASDPRGGIRRTGSPGAFEYVLKPNMANKPVNFVSWLDAARYTNWLFNGEPAGVPDVTTTEAGAFDLSVPDPAGFAVPGFLQGVSMPTEHEWYKAAYFDPAIDAYWTYPTRSDSEPLLALASGVGDVANPGPERVNYASAADWNGLDGNVTSAGSAGAPSAYGALDMAGNVWEWTAADAESGQRVVRGGSFLDDRFALEAVADGQRDLLLRDPAYEGADVGMRLAYMTTSQVPEPGRALGFGAGLVLVLLLARRRRPRAADWPAAV
jgi:formylglycine-generating enzyme required for sulfatase activity